MIPFAALKAISEPTVCRYQLVVCSPLLCDDKSEEQLEEEREAHREHPGMGREQHKRLKSLPKNNTLSQVKISLIRLCFPLLRSLALRISCTALPYPTLPSIIAMPSSQRSWPPQVSTFAYILFTFLKHQYILYPPIICLLRVLVLTCR